VFWFIVRSVRADRLLLTSVFYAQARKDIRVLRNEATARERLLNVSTSVLPVVESVMSRYGFELKTLSHGYGAE
jgi:hypothetical protein